MIIKYASNRCYNIDKMVTTDKGDNDGIVFESEDGGDT